MKDNFGDKITVDTDSDAVFIDFFPNPDPTMNPEDGALQMVLTPAKARKLIRKIERVTSRIEIEEMGRLG